MLEPVRPEAVLLDRALCLPTFSHFLIVKKTSLPLPPPLVVYYRDSGYSTTHVAVAVRTLIVSLSKSLFSLT